MDFSGNAPRYCWYTTDHLGSVRAVTDASGNVFATYAYSPYGEDFAAEQLNDKPLLDRIDLGSKLGGVATIQPNDRPQRRVVNKGAMGSPEVTYSAAEESDWQPFKFSGKESLTRVGLDLYDFGARMYSPSNMRWMTMDPLAEKYYHISPYAYCAGNPVNLVDPDGMQWYLCTHEDKHTSYEYYEGEMPDEEKNKYQNVVKHEKLFFIDPDTNIYYSLFGKKIPWTTLDGHPTQARFTYVVDRLINTFFVNNEDKETGEFNKVPIYIDDLPAGKQYDSHVFYYNGKTFSTLRGQDLPGSDALEHSHYWNSKDCRASIYRLENLPLEATVNANFLKPEKRYWLRA